MDGSARKCASCFSSIKINAAWCISGNPRRIGKNLTQLANFCAEIATYWRCSVLGAVSLFRFPTSCRRPDVKVTDISNYVF
ncbi:hypothethical protein (plasmid) [Ralstonia solanacearum CMR15]|nr:hypothethical protein [Ralstonia solanacearum CMR15]